MDARLTPTALRHLFLSFGIAAVLWFYMFSPWTGGIANFWLNMSLSGVILTAFALTGRRAWRDEVKFSPWLIPLGLSIALLLWVAFWIGDKISTLLFDFSRPQVDAIYSLKDTTPQWVVGEVLFLLIGPAEEVFWRGYIQHTLTARFGANRGFLFTLLCYTLIHVWSFNLMLILSALVAGIAWGGLYRFFPRQLGAIILSHALWDCAVFVVFPI